MDKICPQQQYKGSCTRRLTHSSPASPSAICICSSPVLRRAPSSIGSERLRPCPASSLSAMAASKTCLLLLALVALATVSTTVEASQPAKHGKPRTPPASLVELALVLDLQLCPVQLEVFVASAVVAADQTRRVCPGGKRTALKQVQVDIAVEAVVDLRVDVLDKRGKVVEVLTVVLDLEELVVVKGNAVTLVVSVVLDIDLKVIRFLCGKKQVQILDLSVEALIALGLKH